MIGILIVTHGNFSEGIVQSMELIYGKQKAVAALTLNIQDDIETLAQAVCDQAAELEQGDGVLILVDMLGGSPANVAARILHNSHTACITGVNLPMLLEAVECRGSASLEEVVSACIQTGQAGIIDLNARLHEFSCSISEKG